MLGPATKNLLRAVRRAPAVNWPVRHLTRAILRAFGLSPRLALRYLPASGVVSIRSPFRTTIHMRTTGDDPIASSLFWGGWRGYEPETTPIFLMLARRARTIVDAGAHDGYFSLLASSVNRKARILAFEPFEQTHARLLENIRRTGATNIEPFRIALSASDGTGQLYWATAAATLPDSASLRADAPEKDAHLYQTAVRAMTVETARLDRVAAGQAVDLVKMDTEGTEPDVLRGMKGLLQDQRPDLVCEVLRGYGTASALEEQLEPWGYRYYHLTAAGPVRRSQILAQANEDWASRNYLFSCREEAEVQALWQEGAMLPS